MTIEASFNYPSDLNASLPAAGDARSEGDDHIRGLKTQQKTTWQNISGAVTASHTELNILDGATLTTTELNYVDGVTSNIQTQLDTKLTSTSTALNGRWVEIERKSASSSASITFTTGIGSTYSEYLIVFSDVKPASTSALRLRVSTDGGSNYDAGASDYEYQGTYYGVSAGGGGEGSAGATGLLLTLSRSVNASGSGGACGEVRFWTPTATTHRRFKWDLVCPCDSPAEITVVGGGKRAAAADFDALQFTFVTGNIASGTFILFGLDK